MKKFDGDVWHILFGLLPPNGIDSAALSNACKDAVKNVGSMPVGNETEVRSYLEALMKERNRILGV